MRVELLGFSIKKSLEFSIKVMVQTKKALFTFFKRTATQTNIILL